jgi:hypothetical protein
MSISPAALSDLIAKELSAVTDARVVGAIRDLLIEPRADLIDWDYGAPNQQFLCWTVFHDGKTELEIVFCENGFGPSMPWGLVNAATPDRRRSMGMDSGWFATFLEAWLDSVAATDLDIWRVFERNIDGPSRAVSGELPWTEAWRCRDELASANNDARFEVDASLHLEPSRQ